MMRYLRKTLQDTFKVWTILTSGIVITAILYASLSVVGVVESTSLLVSLTILLGLVALTELVESRTNYLNKLITILGAIIIVILLCAFFIVLTIYTSWFSVILRILVSLVIFLGFWAFIILTISRLYIRSRHSYQHQVEKQREMKNGYGSHDKFFLD